MNSLVAALKVVPRWAGSTGAPDPAVAETFKNDGV
jgi:hypothetical protein